MNNLINNHSTSVSATISDIPLIFNIETADFIPICFINTSLMDINIREIRINKYINSLLLISRGSSRHPIISVYDNSNNIGFATIENRHNKYIYNSSLVFKNDKLILAKYIEKDVYNEIIQNTLESSFAGSFYDLIEESDFFENKKVRKIFNQSIIKNNYSIPDSDINLYLNREEIDKLKDYLSQTTDGFDKYNVIEDSNSEYVKSKIFSGVEDIEFKTIDAPNDLVIDVINDKLI